MLRIAPKSRSGSSQKNIKLDFSEEQLAGIGAVVMAWNELEFMLDCALYSGEALPAECLEEDLPKRKLDEKIKNVRQATREWGLPQAFVDSIFATANAFSDLKDYRNAVVHSRIYDAVLAIGNRITPKGDIQEVLLTPHALTWLSDQVTILSSEMRCVIAVFDLVRNSVIANQSGLSNSNTTNPIPEALEWVTQIDECRRERELLGKPPSF